jgi:hypothetical protein
MDIHKPKPFHGWREFLKEYGIIVLGVVTALAFEQVVEKIRDHGRADETTHSVHAEIVADLGLLQRREAVEPCVTRRLGEVQDLIDHSPAKDTPIWIGHPPLYVLHDSQFRAAEQAGHVTLLPPGEQAAYAKLYSYFDEYNAAEIEEQKALADVRTLEQHPQMTPEVAWRLRSALQQARVARWTEEAIGLSVHVVARQLGLNSSDHGAFTAQSICLPLHTSRDQALVEVIQGRPSKQAYDEP